MTDLPPHLERIGLQLQAAASRQIIKRAERHRLRKRTVTAICSSAVLISGTALAVPPLRSVATGVISDFIGSSSAEAPGNAFSADQLPDWFTRSTISGQPHVLAQKGANRLIAYRNATGDACFEYGPGHLGQCGFPVSPLTTSPVHLNGSTTDTPGELALWGLARDEVARVRIIGRGGTVLDQAEVSTGGFVLTVPKSAIEEETRLDVRDASGNRLSSVSLNPWPDDPYVARAPMP